MDKPFGILPPGLESLSSSKKYEADEKAGDELGQAQFLELMITQLNNQDPMNPMESGDFLGQIAQFGTVSGIAELQKSVVSLADSLQSNQALQASTLVGRTAVIAGDGLTLGGDEALTGVAELAQSAANVRVEIRDATGQVVREMKLGNQPAGPVEFTWDGMGDNAVELPPGGYRFVVEADIGDTTEQVPTFVRERIDSVTLSRDGSPPTLNLANQTRVTLDAIKEIM